MKTIYKYPLPYGRLLGVKLYMPTGAQILSVQMQDGDMVMWALVDPQNPKEHRDDIRIYGTGFELLSSPGRHVATLQDGPFVWHVFERAPA